MGETSVKVMKTSKDGLLNLGIGSEIATCQVLLQCSKEMKITWCEIWAVRRLFQCLCGGRAPQFCTRVFATLHSLGKLPLVGDEFQLEMFSLDTKTLVHFTFQSPTVFRRHLLTEISERYGRTSSIYR
ncbi:hypothetical protein AVEN_1503-1 [Araneus ventricosus]|uniref:Uncharacterized protein n=1 Tax=Araneus ventricosus TaxID=182803 RepID=A0A4Y2GGS6_ARAVE|nr:hypothetical protein AVEN_1503-1 [Araneus ventricosus]